MLLNDLKTLSLKSLIWYELSLAENVSDIIECCEIVVALYLQSRDQSCSHEPLMNVYHKSIAWRLGNINPMLFNRLIRVHTSAIPL